MAKHIRLACPENEGLMKHLLQKRDELSESPKGISENLEKTLSRALTNISNANNPIRSLKDLYGVKGVGKWILRLMKGYFDASSGCSGPEDLEEKGRKTKGNRQYLPQKNSAAYALLITLYRGTADGTEQMRKQDIIDAAEASGLSRAPIVPEKGKGKPSKFGCSPREWYSGWSCMSTLIKKGLVVKQGCPARFKLTEAGEIAARECVVRSNMEDPKGKLENGEGFVALDEEDCQELPCTDSGTKVPLVGLRQERKIDQNLGGKTAPFVGSRQKKKFDQKFDVDLGEQEAVLSVGLRKKKKIDVPLESIERCTRLGYSKEQVLAAFNEISETSQNKEISSLLPSVLCHLRENKIYGQEELIGTSRDGVEPDCDGGYMFNYSSSDANLLSLRACPSSDYHVQKSSSDGMEAIKNPLRMPPLDVGDRFDDMYEVILILDQREKFAVQGSQLRKIIDNICSELKIKINVRQLPVGDGIWVARHKYTSTEYVLDFIVERKNVDDLRSSIRDNRYKDQKLRLLRCGLKKLIYLVEGDPNKCEAAESIKTACFTTELLEGFDVQRSTSMGDTLRKYGYLTRAIAQYYKSCFSKDQSKCAGVCPPYDEFIKRCQELDKITVSDVFAIQLMQVEQVTEDVALAVLDLYPTLVSLAQAYSLLDGDVSAQEGMLRKQSNNVISSVASKNIFQFVWSE